MIRDDHGNEIIRMGGDDDEIIPLTRDGRQFHSFNAPARRFRI